MDAVDRTETGPAVVRADDAPRFAVDEVISGRYRIVRFIARGGMGEVYEVDDAVIGGRVALKVMRRELGRDAAVVRRFTREVALARQVTHEHVCRIFDAGTHDDTPFLTMELLAGETLAERIARGRLDAGAARPIVDAIATGLAAAHRAGVVHRDLKSANVMLVGTRIVITDFGLAHRETGGTMDTGDAIVGSPGYMAPEQVLGEPTSSASDIYALGVVMFELVTGALPFRGETPMATAALRLKQDPPSPRARVPELPAAWDRAIVACLAREPARRPATAEAVVALLDDRVTHRRWPFRALVAALVAAIATVIVVVATRAGAPAKSARAPRQTRLASSPGGRVLVPSLSPDGKRVALADQDLRVMEIDGTPRALVVPGIVNRAAWYPDSSRLLVSVIRGERLEVGVISADGGDYETLLDDAKNAIVSPDGLALAMVIGADVVVTDARGGGRRRMTALTPAPYVTLAWSHDGATLALLDGGDLRTIDVVSGTVKPIAAAQHALVEAGVAWLADGRLVYATSTGDRRLWALAPDATEPVELATFPVQNVTQIDSGDGVHIALALRSASSNTFAGEIDSSGMLADVRQLTHTVDQDRPLGFAADGATVYVPTPRGIAAVPFAGGEPREVTSPRYRNAEVIDGGRTLLAVRSSDGKTSVDELALPTAEPRASVELSVAGTVEVHCARDAPSTCVAQVFGTDDARLSMFERARGLGAPIAMTPTSRTTGAAVSSLSTDGATVALTGYDSGLEIIDVATRARRPLALDCHPQASAWLDARRILVTCMRDVAPHYEIRTVDLEDAQRSIATSDTMWYALPVVEAAHGRVAFASVDGTPRAYLLDFGMR